MLVVPAMEEIHQVCMIMPTKQVSLTPLVNNMSLPTLMKLTQPQVTHADQLISAETAHGLLHLSMRLDLDLAGLLSTRSTLSQATMVYLALTK